jgi:hypothetical protein
MGRIAATEKTRFTGVKRVHAGKAGFDARVS